MVTKDIKTAKSVQEIWNLGFDTEFDLPVVEGLVYDEVTQSIKRAIQPGQTLPTTGTNPALTLAYTDSNLTTLTKTINGVDYQKTLTYDGSGNLTNVSEWVEI